jgi:hypothetical protein
MIWADKFVPGLLDHYMARTAVSGQQTSEPADPNRPNNLWHTVEGDYGARGRFSGEAYADSLQLWATTHRGQVSLVVGTVVAGLLGAASAECLRRKQRRQTSDMRRILPKRRRRWRGIL